jgi:amidophosphoribosyltransferase
MLPPKHTLAMGLIRNHYVGRTFIKPEQTIRDESVRQKFNVLPNFFEGKRIVLVDDSIVRAPPSQDREADQRCRSA